MQSLIQARRKEIGSGDPILSPFKRLAKVNAAPRRGELTLVAGGPGTGKSALMFSWLIKGDGGGKKNSVIYFSADTTGGAQFARAASIATGYSMQYVQQQILWGHLTELEEAVAEATESMWIDTTSRPSWTHVNAVIAAFEMVHGVPPEVIVMDNLKDLDMGVEDEWKGLEEACQFLNMLAKDTGAAVITLHHVSGEHENGGNPIPLSGLRGKVSKTPSMILTLHRAAISDTLFVSVVKNRAGAADATGHLKHGLHADLSTMTFEDDIRSKNE